MKKNEFERIATRVPLQFAVAIRKVVAQLVEAVQNNYTGNAMAMPMGALDGATQIAKAWLGMLGLSDDEVEDYISGVYMHEFKKYRKGGDRP